MTIYNVTDATELQSALSSSSAGDTINLADGSYGSVTLSGYDKNDNTANADPGTWSDNANAWEDRYADFVADPARPENLSLVLIQGGTGAVFTTLTITNCSGLHFKGFKVQHPTISFDQSVVRMTGSVCCLLDGLQIYGAPLASDQSKHQSNYPSAGGTATGFGRGRGIHCGTSTAGAPGTECNYISIRGCYIDEVNDGCYYCGGSGLSYPGTFGWIYKNQIYQVSTDAFRVDGSTDCIYERNLLPYHYHPTLDYSSGGESAHNDTFQSSAQGCKRLVIRYNIRVPGFQGGSRAANHVGHNEGGWVTMQGPFFDDSNNFEDIEVFQNWFIVGNQNVTFIRYANTGTCRVYNNFYLRDPYVTPGDDSGDNPNKVLVPLSGTGTFERARNFIGSGQNTIGTAYEPLGRGIAYGSWAGSYQVDEFYGLDTTALYTAWQCALSDLTVVGGSLADTATYGTGTYGPHELLAELAANSYSWPPPVGEATPAAPVITGVPTISGTTNVGQVLVASAASTSGYPYPTRTWQWYNSVSGAIAGATSSSYMLTSEDEGDTVYVVQTETNTTDPFTDTAQSANTATIGAAASAPTVSTLSPADNATGVDVSSNLVVTFSENVQFRTGLGKKIELWRAGLARETWYIDSDVGTGPHTISISGAVLTINTQNNMRTDADYHIIIEDGAIENTSNIAFAGITADTTWNWSTSATATPQSRPVFSSGATLLLNGAPLIITS